MASRSTVKGIIVFSQFSAVTLLKVVDITVNTLMLVKTTFHLQEEK